MKKRASIFLLFATPLCFGQFNLPVQEFYCQRPPSVGDVVTSGLLAWWRFDEGSGTSVADSSGNGKTGTLSGTGYTWTTSNGSHGALNFDATDGKMSFSVNSSSTTYSIAMWIFPIASSDGYAVLCTVNNNQGLYYRGATRKIDMFGAADNLNNTAITEGAWHHIAITVSAGSLTMYLDGSSDGTGANIAQYTFAAMGNDTGGESFKGKISDARIYNRALSAGEVSTLFANP